MDNPSKITEGGVEYSLGKFDGTNVIYDFKKCFVVEDKLYVIENIATTKNEDFLNIYIFEI
jgi:hypothetical protein